MKVLVCRFLPMALFGFLAIASAPLSKAQSNATCQAAHAPPIRSGQHSYRSLQRFTALRDF